MADSAAEFVQYLAHSRNAGGEGVVETLRTHLQLVANRAAEFASAFAAAEQANAAGLMHDLGKYADQFLLRLSNPRVPGRDHWTAGALVAASLHERLGVLPALAIAGHHAGLPPLQCGKALAQEWVLAMRADENRFTDTDISRLASRYLADGLERPQITTGLVPCHLGASDMLDVRMLFSALVDADFLETEAHFQGDAQSPYCPRENGPAVDWDKALAALEGYLADVRRKRADDPMAAARDVLRQACVAAAAGPQGLFTLSAPTGSGKTLAMLAFALRHAKQNGLRRIVLVMPFLNIIDQTAEHYRAIFNGSNGFHPCTVLEHHSLSDYGEPPRASGQDDGRRNVARLLAENWDAPIVLTTNVQFFESLLADRPSRCRKLHRLARSVILFDEVQTLPPKLAVASLATLSRLTDPAGPYHATAVFATATQPAFESFDGRVRSEFAAAGWRPTEIVPDAQSLYAAAAGRVRVSWRYQSAIELDDLADELAGHRQVLCIVNLKRHAVQLATVLQRHDEGSVLHLSTNMCPAHRMRVLGEVRARLDDDLPIRLVATQCVEAGVDLDFPIVYRALGPLEAIAQAAGRCNRHARRSAGQLIVFKPADDRSPYPPGYRAAVDATTIFLNDLARRHNLDTIEILNDPDRLSDYFRQLYVLSGRLSSESKDEEILLNAIRSGDFAEVARYYHLIDSDTVRVVAPYDQPTFRSLADQAAQLPGVGLEAIRCWCRQAAGHAVGVYRPTDAKTMAAFLEPVRFGSRDDDSWAADWYIALPGLPYDRLVGLTEPVENLWIV